MRVVQVLAVGTLGLPEQRLPLRQHFRLPFARISNSKYATRKL
jgi:hypothetical protein